MSPPPYSALVPPVVRILKELPDTAVHPKGAALTYAKLGMQRRTVLCDQTHVTSMVFLIIHSNQTLEEKERGRKLILRGKQIMQSFRHQKTLTMFLLIILCFVCNLHNMSVWQSHMNDNHPTL